MSTVTSTDGATAYPAVNPLNAEVGKLLAGEFRTYTYDRRGRGNSTDTWPTLIPGPRALAELLPTATLQPVRGESHAATLDVLAPALRRFAHEQR